MAIAAIVIHSLPHEQECVSGVLQLMKPVIEWKTVSPDRIAATIECPSLDLLATLQQIKAQPAVLEMDLVFVNYEDDIDAEGYVPCPPLEQLKKSSKNSNVF